ncbi:chemotaxis protein CheW [Trichlorobacter lovleyi]|uniref:chemotaxis protein CheW n=1 Tax=Trichlorobacter lovleyi TaxID=313985 RepID=UPI0023F25174|nr:chemotaxis protein CheW [Trichlorobacter lovleyi]
MELAKIRNKARQEGAPGATEEVSTPLPEPVVLQPDHVVPPALTLSDDSAAQQAAPVSFPGPAMARAVPAAAHFDPLAVILAGREHDRSTNGTVLPETEQEHQTAASEERFEEFLCFRLGDEEYGINIMEIKEIIKSRELTEVPRTPGFVDGVLSLRGVIVPVFTMRKRLGMSLDYDAGQERIIIVRCGDSLHGLRVDRVTDVVKIAATDREATPSMLEGVAREFVSGIGRTGKRMLIILDICKVVDTALGEVG